jgi:hypothetical protein
MAAGRLPLGALGAVDARQARSGKGCRRRVLERRAILPECAAVRWQRLEHRFGRLYAAHSGWNHSVIAPSA